ncbi:uncharacterized protein PAC_00960 [Phialocephala subalpina]|uniref:Uncharacterized protein n=1 Tax=Phialocephala subalpina TaxID=576137 RepID=A0A1L7WE63_9HELO|nr:uncharacterized protein PAC_00960 [Phialocephala subalpina]
MVSYYRFESLYFFALFLRIVCICFRIYLQVLYRIT